MRPRPTEALFALALTACAASPSPAPVALAPTAPAAAPTPTPGPAPAPAAAPALEPAPAPTPAPLPPPRPPIIRRSTGDGVPTDVELAGGDDALTLGNIDAAEKHFMAALALAPKSPAVAVGLARVRIA